MSYPWRAGNQIQLLENGEEYFPRLFQSIDEARSEIMLETFILFEDSVGMALHKHLLNAAQRNVNVMITVDGYGTHELSEAYIARLTDAGVKFRIFDPRPKLLGLRTNLFRRLHRKLVVIDGRRAFVGGINLSEDHLESFGRCAKQDYMAEISGPLVFYIHEFMSSAFASYGQPAVRFRRRRKFLYQGNSTQDAEAVFVFRDNEQHRTSIEEHYVAAMRRARRRLVIANAYFFPGYRFFRELCNAARRGGAVDLILQGRSDMRLAKAAAKLLYDHLLQAGVRLYECSERPMHAKVALVDDEWMTIGSSNLDPLSLSFNLESNIVVKDRELNRQMSEKLAQLIQVSCKLIDKRKAPTLWSLCVSFAVFHFLRHFPSWAVMLPKRSQKVSIQGKDELQGSQH